MKRTLLAIVAAFLMMTSAYAQRLANVRAEATLITDKMVLELGLSNAQRNGILNINLNYLNGIRSYRDIDSYGWECRNRELRRMLTARQWQRFKEAYYFYRPIEWRDDVSCTTSIRNIRSITGSLPNASPITTRITTSTTTSTTTSIISTTTSITSTTTSTTSTATSITSTMTSTTSTTTSASMASETDGKVM